MSQSTYEDIFGTDNSQPQGGDNLPGPAQLREAYEKMKAERDELRQQRERDVAKAKADAVDQFVKDKNLPSEAKALIGDQDPANWYEQYTKIFGAPAEAATPPAEEAKSETTAPVGDSALSAEQQAEIAAVAQTEALPFEANNLAARDAYLDDATSLPDLEERLRKAGLLIESHGQR
jgi:hypothetical protein